MISYKPLPEMWSCVIYIRGEWVNDGLWSAGAFRWDLLIDSSVSLFAKQSPPVHSAGDDAGDDHPGRVQSTSMQIQVLCLSVSITGERSSGVSGGVSVYQAPLHSITRRCCGYGGYYIQTCVVWIWRKIIINWHYFAETCWNASSGLCRGDMANIAGSVVCR